MARIKLTKSAVDAAKPQAQAFELRDTVLPGFLCKITASKAQTMKEYCHTFMEDYSKQRNKPGTQRGYQGVIDRCIIPILGRMKVQDVKRPDGTNQIIQDVVPSTDWQAQSERKQVLSNEVHKCSDFRREVTA